MTNGNWIFFANMQTNMKVGGLTSIFQLYKVHVLHSVLGPGQFRLKNGTRCFNVFFLTGLPSVWFCSSLLKVIWLHTHRLHKIWKINSRRLTGNPLESCGSHVNSKTFSGKLNWESGVTLILADRFHFHSRQIQLHVNSLESLMTVWVWTPFASVFLFNWNLKTSQNHPYS